MKFEVSRGWFGEKGWTTMWGGKNEGDWVTGFMINSYLGGSNSVPFSWLSDGIEKTVMVPCTSLKIKKKLPAWKEIYKHGCPA